MINPLQNHFLATASFVKRDEATALRKILNGRGLQWVAFKLADALYTDEMAFDLLQDSINDALLGWPLKIKDSSRRIPAGFVSGLDDTLQLDHHPVTPEQWALLEELITERIPKRGVKAASPWINTFAKAACERLGNDASFLDGTSREIIVDHGIVALEKKEGRVLLTTRPFSPV